VYRRKGAVAAWAWLISLLLHVVVLGAFSTMRLTGRPDTRVSKSRAEAARAQIRRISEALPVTPKPRITHLLSASGSQSVSKRPLDIPVRSRIAPAESAEAIDVEASGDAFAGALWSRGVEFFGQFTDVRKICYVVDCSGSMHGRIGLVKKRLKASIASLRPDQFFYVIFFLRGESLLESGDGVLVRATPSAKSAAYDFVDQAMPAGTTNPLNALRRAMELRDDSGAGAGLIYFLTDGFDFEPDGSATFAEQVSSLRAQLAGDVVINTLGFWTQAGDEAILREIARMTGGEFVDIEW